MLEARAALAGGWPRLWVEAPDEAALLAIRGTVEAILGPLPQADELEPWHPDEPWALRVDLPEVPHDALAEVIDALSRQEAPVRLEPADPPAVTEALDRGVLIPDMMDGARMLVDPAEGPVQPELWRSSEPDDAVLELEAELVGALRAVDPSLQLRSDRGPDTVSPVVERATGRLGVELDVDDRRKAVLRAVAAVVEARRDHPDLQLSGRASWENRLGRLQLVLWLVAPPAAALPGDDVVKAGPPPLSWLDTLRRDAPGLVEDLEVQVVPAGAAAHDPVASAVSAVAGRAGWSGGRPRWLRSSAGWVFCPVWRAGFDQLAHVSSLASLAGVHGVRVVPGEPSGLSEPWPTIDPAWRQVGDRCFVRLRDARRDRDRLERVEERPPDERDHAVAADIPQDVRPVVDRRGRRGLEVEAGSEALSEPGLVEVLAAAGRVDHPDVLGIGTLGFVADGARVRLWYRDAVKPGSRVWRGQPRPRE